MIMRLIPGYRGSQRMNIFIRPPSFHHSNKQGSVWAWMSENNSLTNKSFDQSTSWQIALLAKLPSCSLRWQFPVDLVAPNTPWSAPSYRPQRPELAPPRSELQPTSAPSSRPQVPRAWGGGRCGPPATGYTAPPGAPGWVLMVVVNWGDSWHVIGQTWWWVRWGKGRSG